MAESLTGRGASSQMTSQSKTQFLAYHALVLLLLLSVVHQAAEARVNMNQMCGLDKNHMCKREIKHVPPQVTAVCSACGDLWGNIPGFEYCCTCSHMIFDFCYNAVMGSGPSRFG